MTSRIGTKRYRSRSTRLLSSLRPCFISLSKQLRSKRRSAPPRPPPPPALPPRSLALPEAEGLSGCRRLLGRLSGCRRRTVAELGGGVRILLMWRLTVVSSAKKSAVLTKNSSPRPAMKNSSTKCSAMSPK